MLEIVETAGNCASHSDRGPLMYFLKETSNVYKSDKMETKIQKMTHCYYQFEISKDFLTLNTPHSTVPMFTSGVQNLYSRVVLSSFL